MKKSLKVSLVLMLIIVSVFAVCMIESSAGATTVGSGKTGKLTWVFDSDGVLTISGNGAMPNYTSSTVPWETYDYRIKKVVINNGVTSIGDYAFYFCDLKSITLPEGLTSIGDYAFRGCHLKSINLPSTLTQISDYAFYNNDFTTIKIPEGVTTIKEWAFGSCVALTTVSLPVTLKTIEYAAFGSCTSIETVYYSGFQEDWDKIEIISDYYLCEGTLKFVHADGTPHNFITYAKKAPTCTENGWNGYKTCTICNYTTYSEIPALGHKAFSVTTENDASYPFKLVDGIYTSTNKEKSTSSVYTIRATATSKLTISYAVSSYQDIDYLKIKKNGTTLVSASGEHDFKQYTVSVVKGDVITISYERSILSSTKGSNCGWFSITEDISYINPTCTESVTCLTCKTILKEATGHNYINYICQNCNDDRKAASGKWGQVSWVVTTDGELIVSGGGVSIPDTEFTWYYPGTNIKNVIILDGITGIGKFAFKGLTNLETVTIPRSVGIIGTNAFYNCPLQKIKYTGDEYDWDSITINDNTLANIEIEYVHKDGTPHDYIVHPAKAPTCEGDGHNEYLTCSKCDFTTYVKIWPIGHNYNSGICQNCGDNIIVYSGISQNISWVIDENKLLTISGEGDMPIYSDSKAPWLDYYWNGYDDPTFDKVVIKPGITSISPSAFNECFFIWAVGIPEGVTSIGADAFHACMDLTAVNIPDSVVYIGPGAFATCGSSLTHIDLPNGITHIYSSTFESCYGLQNVTIPESVVYIGDSAFAWCESLSSITISKNVEYLGKDVFKKCDSLEKIYFKGNYSQWKCLTANIPLTAEVTFIHDDGSEHSYINHDAKAPTCTEIGWNEYATCSQCSFTTYKELPALGHDEIVADAQAPSCTVAGYERICCSRCDYTYSYDIPAIGHGIIFKEINQFGQGTECTSIYTCTGCTYQEIKTIDGFFNYMGNLYYCNNGWLISGWFTVDGKTYYASSSTNVVINYSKKISGKYYIWNDETGLVLADGFVTDEGGTKCYENGVQVIGWRHEDGSGPKVVGGISEQYSSNPEGLYYFLSTTGYMVTSSTYKLGGYNREFNEDHTVKAMNGLQTNAGELYYYVDGVKQTGWQTVNDTTYYFRASDAVYGRAATKWMYIGNKVYYFYASTSATPYALKDSGAIGGITYTYHEDGYILYNGFVNCDYANAANSNTAANIQKKNGTTRYYVNGEMQTGWQQIGGKWYYFYAIGSANGSGYMCTQSRTIGGVYYEFTAEGVCTNK